MKNHLVLALTTTSLDVPFLDLDPPSRKRREGRSPRLRPPYNNHARVPPATIDGKPSIPDTSLSLLFLSPHFPVSSAFGLNFFPVIFSVGRLYTPLPHRIDQCLDAAYFSVSAASAVTTEYSDYLFARFLRPSAFLESNFKLL